MVDFNFSAFLEQHYKSERGYNDIPSKFNYLENQRDKADQYLTKVAETSKNDLVQDLNSEPKHHDININDSGDIRAESDTVLNYEFTGHNSSLDIVGNSVDDSLSIDMSHAKNAWIIKVELDDGNTAIEISDNGINYIVGDNYVSASDSINLIELSNQSGTIQLIDHSGNTEVIDFSGIDNIFWS